MVFVASWISERKAIGRSIPAHWSYQYHTRECYERDAEAIREFRGWRDEWPDFCQGCGAVGIVTWEENGAPFGEGYWGMPMEDICDSCIGDYEMHCPRCGEEIYTTILRNSVEDDEAYTFLTDSEREHTIDLWYENNEPCPICGWQWGKNKYDYAPSLPDGPCGCYEYEDWDYQVGKRPVLGKRQRWCFEKLGLWTQRFFKEPIVLSAWED